MRVAVISEHRVAKKDAFGALVRTVFAAFENAGLSPAVGLLFSDSPLPGSTAVVGRVLKRFPDLRPLAIATTALPGMPARSVLSGFDEDGNVRQNVVVSRDTLLAIVDGVPRSFPFHTAAIHVSHPAFGESANPGGTQGPPQFRLVSGVRVTDDWWVNGRQRSCTSVVIVEADGSAPELKLPPQPEAVVAALAKPKKTTQIVLPGDSPAVQPGVQPLSNAGIGAIVQEFRAAMPELMQRVNLPHDLPPVRDALAIVEQGGPLKPTLVELFGPRGYDCKGGTGVFSLTRRTPSNLAVELSVDVGTWSRMVTPSYRVSGPGFQARLSLRVGVRADGVQYPIGGPERWRKIVENLAVIVDELDRTFVPRIEAAAGPAPAWFQPGRTS